MKYKVIFDVDEEQVKHIAPSGEELSVKDGIDLLFFFMQCSGAKLVSYQKVEPKRSIELGAYTHIPKLYITVVDGKVTEIWYDDDYGIDRMLSEGSEYVLEYPDSKE